MRDWESRGWVEAGTQIIIHFQKVLSSLGAAGREKSALFQGLHRANEVGERSLKDGQRHTRNRRDSISKGTRRGEERYLGGEGESSEVERRRKWLEVGRGLRG